MDKTKLHFIVNNHFDLMWRRCADEAIIFEGKSFVPYADIQEYYIEENLALTREYPFYAFQVESTAVLRKYLRQHPEAEAEIQKLARDGRLFVPFSGDNIIDTNLVGAESIIRNYLVGKKWLGEVLGISPAVCDRLDAFGNNAQLPQIMRLFGISWITNLSYTTVGNKKYWRGLDGSTVLCLSVFPAQYVGDWAKYAPCPACNGFKHTSDGNPCTVCGGRGIDFDKMEQRYPDVFTLSQSIPRNDGYPNIVLASCEEILPHKSLPKWASEHIDEFDIHFSDVYHSLSDIAKPLLDRLDSPESDLVFDGELNPNNTGIYTTRIRTKQRIRELEAKTAAAEFLWLSASENGADYPYGEFADIWEILHYGMFHDAVTGTHVDAAYNELMRSCDIIENKLTVLSEKAAQLLSSDENSVTVINPSGGKMFTEYNGQTVSVPPLSAVTFTDKSKAEEPIRTSPDENGICTIENERYRVTADNSGIIQIYDSTLGCNISSEIEYRPAELILEHDEGSPWSTLSPDQRRVRMSCHTTLIKAEKASNTETLTFEINGGDHSGYATAALSARLTVSLTRGIPRVEFHLDTEWHTYNQRLRIAFPVPMNGCHLYGIPAGVIERKQYEYDGLLPDGASYWSCGCGDWPALYFAGISSDKTGVALFNRGTPSNRIEHHESSETVLLTVLRSPNNPTYLHEPTNYTMTDWNGMSDHGSHSFDFAITSYPCGLYDSDCVRDAAAYNSLPYIIQSKAVLPEMPEISAEAQLLGIKKAEDGCGIILHISEQHGKNAVCKITIPERYHEVQLCTLDEEPLEQLAIENRAINIKLKPFEIIAVRIK